MTPTKKCYANEEWTQWNFIFLHYVVLVLAGLHSSVISWMANDKGKKTPNLVTLTKFVISTIKGKISAYLPRHLRLTVNINMLFVKFFDS